MHVVSTCMYPHSPIRHACMKVTLQVHACDCCPDSYEDEVFQEWSREVEEVSRINLEKPLLLKDNQTSNLALNFDPKVRECMLHILFLN